MSFVFPSCNVKEAEYLSVTGCRPNDIILCIMPTLRLGHEARASFVFLRQGCCRLNTGIVLDWWSGPLMPAGQPMDVTACDNSNSSM